MLLGEAYEVSFSSAYITIKYTRFVGVYPYQRSREIATVSFNDNRLILQYAGQPFGHKCQRFNFQRELTPEKVVSYILARVINRMPIHEVRKGYCATTK